MRQNRFYSISSSSRVSQSRLSVTVAVARRTTPSGRLHKGELTTLPSRVIPLLSFACSLARWAPLLVCLGWCCPLASCQFTSLTSVFVFRCCRRVLQLPGQAEARGARSRFRQGVHVPTAAGPNGTLPPASFDMWGTPERASCCRIAFAGRPLHPAGCLRAVGLPVLLSGQTFANSLVSLPVIACV